MYVCICHGVTDRQIRQAADAGVTTVEDLSMLTGCSASCGQCRPMAQSILDQTTAQSRPRALQIVHDGTAVLAPI